MLSLVIGVLTLGSMHITAYALSEADDEGELVIGRGTDSVSLWLSWLKVILILIVIIGLIYVLVRFLAKKNQTWFGGRSIRVLSGIQLAPNKSVQVIEIGGIVYVLGVGDDVRLIDKITDQELASLIIEQFDIQDTSSFIPAFERLQRFINRRRSSDIASDLPNQQTFQQIFQDRLERVSGQSRQIDKIMSDIQQDEKERSER